MKYRKWLIRLIYNHENPDKIEEVAKFKAVKEKEAHQICIAKFKADAANRGIREEKVTEFLMAKREEKLAVVSCL